MDLISIQISSLCNTYRIFSVKIIWLGTKSMEKTTGNLREFSYSMSEHFMVVNFNRINFSIVIYYFCSLQRRINGSENGGDIYVTCEVIHPTILGGSESCANFFSAAFHLKTCVFFIVFSFIWLDWTNAPLTMFFIPPKSFALPGKQFALPTTGGGFYSGSGPVS